MTQPYLTHLAELGTSDLHPLGQQATVSLIKALALQPGQRVLEIGCGTGRTMVRVALSHKVRVDGIDALPPMLWMARKRLWLAGLRPRTSLSHATGTKLPFAGQTYDRVYTESVLGFQNATNAEAMLEQIFRVLKPGGCYVANEAIWKPGVSTAFAAALYATCVADFGICQTSEQPWSLDDWLGLAHAVGFEVAAADILEEQVSQVEGIPSEPIAWRQVLADSLTWYYRARGRLNWRLKQQRAEYRGHLEAHREDGRYMESRLLVLTKPWGDYAQDSKF